MSAKIIPLVLIALLTRSNAWPNDQPGQDTEPPVDPNVDTICKLTEEDVAKTMTSVFAVGEHVYLANDTTYYGFNVTTVAADQVQRWASTNIIGGISFFNILTMVHFRAPTCDTTRDDCKKLTELILVFSIDSEPKYESYRYETNRQVLEKINDNTDMPWGLPHQGTIEQFWDAINMPESDQTMTNPRRTNLASMMFTRSASRLYVMHKENDLVRFTYKVLESDGVFNPNPTITDPGPSGLWAIIDDRYGFAFAVTRNDSVITFAQLSTMLNGTVGRKFTAKEFFNCDGQRPTPTHPPDTTDSMAPNGPDSPTNGPTEGNPSPSGSGFGIIVIIVIVLILIVVIVSVVFFIFWRKSQSENVDKPAIGVAPNAPPDPSDHEGSLRSKIGGNEQPSKTVPDQDISTVRSNVN